MKLSKYVCGAVRQFSLWFAKGSLGYPLLEGIDYTGEVLKEESSFAEQAFAVFMNNLETDENGNVLNYKYSEKRAAQYIRSYFDSSFTVDPPFESWEVELHPVSKDSYVK
jgi:hypothetical protein